MLEILFIFGLLGLLLGTFLEYLASLQGFPTILTAFFVVPMLSWALYLELLRRFELEHIGAPRPPVPPERFYWTLHRTRLRITLLVSLPLAIVAWTAALEWPASLEPTSGSLSGWLAGATAILSTTAFASCLTIYVRASHWFDKMTPWAVGACRRSLYRISGNPDFLAPENPVREEKEKSIY